MTVKPEYGIVRNNSDDGWYVMSIRHNMSPKAFFDIVYEGDPAASYDAAQSYNAELRPYVKRIKNYTRQRSDKKHQELPIGITLGSASRLNPGGKGRTLVYNFKVSLLCGKTTTIYIGTEATWLSNYQSALKKAILRRTLSKAELYKP